MLTTNNHFLSGNSALFVVFGFLSSLFKNTNYTRTRSFQFVTCLCPMTMPQLEIDVDDLSRLLMEGGYGLLGMSTDIWEREQVFAKLQQLFDDKFIDLLMMQRIGLKDPKDEDYTLFLFRALT